jgi:hypothetical protein
MLLFRLWASRVYLVHLQSENFKRSEILFNTSSSPHGIGFYEGVCNTYKE